MKPFKTADDIAEGLNNLINGGPHNVCDFCDEIGTKDNRVYFDPHHKTRICQNCIKHEPYTEEQLAQTFTMDDL